MADNSDIINSALRRAMRYEGGYDDDFDLTPAYSTADIVRGVDPLAGVGSRLGTKWTSPAQDEAARQRFLEAEHKPTLIGKSLGAIGIDESGQRAATPWLDAFMSTLHMPSRFLQAGQQALTAPSRALTNDVSYYDTAIPQRDANGNEYISDMGPIAPGTAIPEGLNFAGTIASSSPIATATGAVPANTAGMFAGRLAKTADHAALAKAEKMAAEGLPREQIWKETGWFQGKDGKWRFEIDDSAIKSVVPLGGWINRQNGVTMTPHVGAAYEQAMKDLAPGAPVRVKRLFAHDELDKAYPHGFTNSDQHNSITSLPVGLIEQGTNKAAALIDDKLVALNEALLPYEAKSATAHELQHAVQNREGFAPGSNAEAPHWMTGPNGEPTWISPQEAYTRSAGEVEARTVQKRLNLKPEERRARPPWEDYDIPESQQIVRGVSSNPEESAGVGAAVRAAAEDAVQKALALPMDEASRMARANEMGFDRSLWHQTHKDNVPSIMDQGFDVGRVGARRHDEQMPDGVFLKNTDRDIQVGASGDDAAQIPIRARLTNPARFANRDDLAKFLNRDPVYRELAEDVNMYDKLRARDFNKIWYDDTISGEKKQTMLDANLAETDAGLSERAAAARARATKLLKDAGHDGLVMDSDKGGLFNKRTVPTTVVFDSNNLRHPDAAFDPSKSDSSNLLASNKDASIPGVIVRDAAEKPIRAYHGTNSDLTGGFSRIDPGNARGDAYYFTTSPRAAGDGYAMGNTNRITPKGDAGPNVVPVDIGARLFDENDIVSPSDRLKLAEAFNEKQTARAKERGRDVYPDELMKPDEFASTWFDRAYPAKGQNVLQSLTYDPNEQNALLSSLGYQGRTGYPAGTGAARAGQDIAIFPEVGRGTVRSATTGDILYSNGDKSSIPGTLVRSASEDPVTRALRVARSLDPLGYYSKLDEVLGGFKPTDKVTSQTLQQRGVKASEIEARGLKNLLADGSSVSVSELQGVAKGNGVGLNESKYGTTENWVVDPWQWGHGRGEPRSFALQADAESYARSIGLTPEHATPVTSKPAKWSDYSLDKGNPTYRETVLRLDEPQAVADARAELERLKSEPYSSDKQPELDRLRKVVNDWDSGVGGFVDSHFPGDKGYIAHARTSIQKDTAGNDVFLVEELQSGIGQKIRDKGARDEGRIAELRQQISEQSLAIQKLVAAASAQAVNQKVAGFVSSPAAIIAEIAERPQATSALWRLVDEGHVDRAFVQNLLDAIEPHIARRNLLNAELRTAEAATPSHPLVNTTDQWTTTALRRLIKQAVDSGADAISFTPGKVQAERFGLEKHLDRIVYAPETGRLTAFDKNGNGVLERAAKPDELPEIIGKEMTDKLLASKPYTSGGGREMYQVQGADLKVGGEGMRATYDSMYPRTLGKILSKMDPSVKMETRKLTSSEGHPFRQGGLDKFTRTMLDEAGGDIDKAISDIQSGRFPAESKQRSVAALQAMKETGDDGTLKFITFPITDKIRKAVGEGQPLFSNSDRSSLPGSALRQGEQEGRVGSGKANKASDGSEEVIKRAINVSADEGAVEDALKVAKNIQDGRKSEVASARLNELNAEISQLNKTAEAAFSAHMAERPEGHPKAAWMSAFETVAPPEWHRRQRLIQERQEIQSKAESKERSAAKREAMQPLNDAATAYADVIANAHKNNELAFRPMSVSDFNSAPHIKLHKSPTHNRTQSSEYRLVMIDGRPAYARKSNHWGAFSTNITDIDDAVRHLGISHAEAERRALSDDFGRIGSKSYNWNLDGDKGSRASRAGYVFLDDLPSAKDSAIKRALSVSGKYTD